MKKRIVSTLITVCITSALATAALYPAKGVVSLTNFEPVRTYSGEFSDVPQDAWYYDYISGAYERAIIDGTGGGLFLPDGKITIAEVIKLAACLHKGYSTGSTLFESAEPWYKPYVEYARENGIFSGEYKNYNAPATRADFAHILASALPDEALTPINKIPDGAIPDVYEGFSYGESVYKLYRAGIFMGADSGGAFYPSRTLRRSEASAAVLRMIDADRRVTLSLGVTLTSEELFKKCSPSVFFLEIFDEDGTLVKTGSGFFISQDGLAVTNHHVITGSHSAKITTPDGEVFDVAGIYDYNRKKDIALIQIEGSGFPFLEAAESGNVLTGASIYTIGSPLGLQNSFSKGIISAIPRNIEGAEYIQIDAVISSGSSGGALLDTAGRVIGVTSAALGGGQSLNFAVPITFVDDLSRESIVPLKSLIKQIEYYADYYPVPDFGAYYGIKLYKQEKLVDQIYSYLLSDMPNEPGEMLDGYAELLEQNLYTVFGYYTIEGYNFTAYYNAKHNSFVMTGIEKVNGKECISIQIS